VLTGIRTYLTESWSELKKVAWPSRDTVLNLTLIVVGVSVAVGASTFALDQIFHFAIGRVLQ
jgi:preprotein translocase subunit SecE